MVDASDLKPFRRHAEWALVAATAGELGVYDRLSEGPATRDELVEDLDLSRRGVAILLGVLEEMGLAREEPEDVYRITGVARGHLIDPETLDYQADALAFWLHNIRIWAGHLPRALRSGEPVEEEPGEEEPTEEERVARFMAAMANKNPELVESVVEATLERAPRSGRFLDLGGGPGTFSRAILERGYEGVLFDTPEVVDHVADDYGLQELDGLELVEGDFLETLPEEEFDVVLLANITHIYDADTNAELLGRVARNVAPGGVLSVMDFVRGVSEFAALFAVTMLMNTERGNTYDLRSYERWLEDAGLSEVRCRTVQEDRQVVTAVRP